MESLIEIHGPDHWLCKGTIGIAWNISFILFYFKWYFPSSKTYELLYYTQFKGRGNVSHI